MGKTKDWFLTQEDRLEREMRRLSREEKRLERKERELISYAKQLDDIKEDYESYHKELMKNFELLTDKEQELRKREMELKEKEMAYAHHHQQIEQLVNYEKTLRAHVELLQKEIEKLNRQRLQAIKPATHKLPAVLKTRLIPPEFKKPS